MLDNHYPAHGPWEEMPWEREQCPDCKDFESEVNEMITELLMLLEDTSKPLEGKVIVAKKYLDDWAKDNL